MIAWAIAGATAAHAGAWTRSLGDSYVKVHGEAYATGAWEAQGEAPAGRYLGQQLGLYGELGVLPGWRGQLTASVPWVVGTLRGTTSDPFGTRDLAATSARVGDLRLAAQAAVHPRLPLGVFAELKVPGYANDSVGRAYPTYQKYFPKPGDGQVDLAAGAVAGLSPWDGGFAELAVGWVHRTEWFLGWETDLAFTDGLRSGAKVGQRFGRWLPLLAVDATISPSPSPATRSLVTASAAAMADLGRGLSLEPRVAWDLWAQHASRGVSAGLGLSHRRPPPPGPSSDPEGAASPER